MWQTVGILPRARRRPDAADAQHHFLPDAHVVIAAVEPGGDLAIVGAVLRNVACRAGRAARGRPGSARCASRRRGPGKGTLIKSGVPSGLRLGDQRQIEEVVLGIAFLLPAVDVEILAEIALAVHQADADQRQCRGRDADLR